MSISSKSAAQRWGQDRERPLLQHGPPQQPKELPTLKEFAPRFMDGHARANRQKASGIAAKEVILRVHLIPALGHERLDAITNEDVQRLKTWLRAKAPKTVNNVLSALLKNAVDWNVIERTPCSIKLLPVSKGSTRFYDFDEFERLVTADKPPIRVRTSSCCWRAKPGYDSARWSPSNGATSTSPKGRYA